MSRSTTTSAAAPQTTKAAPMAQPMQGQASVPTDKVAMLAYQKWLKAGCKHGCDKQHWFEAESELKAEMARSRK